MGTFVGVVVLLLTLIPFLFPAGTTEAYPLDRKQLPLATFSLIEDFGVILQGVIDKKRQQKEPHEYNVFFFSPSRGRGYLAHFLPGCYTSHELQQDTFTIPIGNFTTPYVDFDQGWAVLLAADDAFVFILMHVGEEEGYQTWFKVEKRRYYQQWEKAIQLCQRLSNKV